MNTKVLVVGDVMLDRYWRADAERISPEAPVPVAKINDMQDRLGGAGNVAQNITALSGQVSLASVVGADNEGELLESLLSSNHVTCALVKEPQLRTTTKIRIVSRNQQLIRLDFDDNAADSITQVKARVADEIDDCHIVLLSDYGKGVLADAQAIIELAKQHNKKIVVDPKGSDFSKYRNASVITPNYAEFSAVVGPCNSEQEIQEKAQQLCEQLSLEALLITRSSQGMTLVMHTGEVTHFPAQVREVYDVTGAGDTVIAVFAMWLARGEDYAQSAQVANVAASLVVGKFGASTVSLDELTHALLHYEYPQSKLISQELMLEKIHQARNRQQKIVFTNGCFDVLHKGHAHLLHQAATHGDMLIVALNTDASVRKLKGEDRPINTLEDRAEMLSHLASVDWVVAFAEDTPIQLIESLKPDVLVKGGDYTMDQIVGSDLVLANGGEVKVIPIVEGYSTTNIIAAINDKS